MGIRKAQVFTIAAKVGNKNETTKKIQEKLNSSPTVRAPKSTCL